jgi:ATP-dependent DNA ligase
MPDAFGEGHALFDAVCEWEMEGVVAKRLHDPYKPGERAWVKTKNREYRRYEMERERCATPPRSSASASST